MRPDEQRERESKTQQETGHHGVKDIPFGARPTGMFFIAFTFTFTFVMVCSC